MSDLPRLTSHSPVRVSASWDVDESQETRKGNWYQGKGENDNGSYRDLKVVGVKMFMRQPDWLGSDKGLNSVVENDWERARVAVQKDDW